MTTVHGRGGRHSERVKGSVVVDSVHVDLLHSPAGLLGLSPFLHVAHIPLFAEMGRKHRQGRGALLLRPGASSRHLPQCHLCRISPSELTFYPTNWPPDSPQPC